MEIALRFSILFTVLFVGTSCKYDPGEFAPHIYLTWHSEDTATTMMVHYQTDGHVKSPQTFYDTEPRNGDPANYRFHRAASSDSFKGTSRQVHHVHLTGLSAFTTYYFIVGDEESGYSEEKKFRTLPNDRTTPIHFVSGGDMGSGQTMARITKLAGDLNPDFALIGGDIAYANGDYKNTKRWDDWFKIIANGLVAPDGRIIPLILAIGNHEVGFKLPGPKRLMSPFYFKLFYQTPKDGTYFQRNIGQNLVLYMLDTGHQAPRYGLQQKWMIDQFHKTQSIPYRIAVYHMPLYPSVRAYSGSSSILGRLSWLPIFDHYRLTTIFENHDHSFKRSKPLRDGKVKNDGTIFLGDGAWGRGPREVDPSRWYLEKTQSRNHIWNVTVTSEHINYRAVDENGNLLDEFVQLATEVSKTRHQKKMKVPEPPKNGEELRRKIIEEIAAESELNF